MGSRTSGGPRAEVHVSSCVVEWWPLRALRKSMMPCRVQSVQDCVGVDQSVVEQVFLSNFQETQVEGMSWSRRLKEALKQTGRSAPPV